MERLTCLKTPARWDSGRHPTKYTSRSTFPEVVERLAAYEDTGLMPEEITKALEDCADTVAENQWAIRLLEELGELLQAKQDGRLVVLPCKVGDLVFALWDVLTEYKYVIYCVEVKEIRISVRNCRLTTKYRLEPIEYRGRIKEYLAEDFGKTVFLTREEAEAALKGGVE